MPFAVTENFDSRKVTWTKDRELATLTYTGYGSDDDAVARESFNAEIPLTFKPFSNTLVRLNLEVWTMGGLFWQATADYGPDNAPLYPGVGAAGDPTPLSPLLAAPGPNTPLGPGYSFDFTGITERIFQSKETTFSLKRPFATIVDPLMELPAGPAPDCQQAIGQTKDDIEGCERISPNLEWSRTVTFEFITQVYIDAVAALAGTTNISTFYGLPAGTQLFMGGNCQTDDVKKAKVTFKFLSRPNVSTVLICTGITIEPPPGRAYAKGGHEYVWCSYRSAFSENRHVFNPKSAYVEQIYSEADFSALRIGS